MEAESYTDTGHVTKIETVEKINWLINTRLGGLTLDPTGMHCPPWDDAFVSSLALASPMLEISEMFHGSRVIYPQIYRFTIEIVEIR